MRVKSTDLKQYIPKKPNKITFLQTMNCNLKCRHCSVSEYDTQEIHGMNINSAKLFKKYDVNIQISLDGPTKESHEEIRGKNTWNKTIQSIKLLKEYGIDLQTNMVYHEGNIHLIEEYFKLCRENGVRKIRLISLMNLGRAVGNLTGGFSINKHRKFL